mgnify:CR=1 FL=1
MIVCTCHLVYCSLVSLRLLLKLEKGKGKWGNLPEEWNNWTPRWLDGERNKKQELYRCLQLLLIVGVNESNQLERPNVQICLIILTIWTFVQIWLACLPNWDWTNFLLSLNVIEHETRFKFDLINRRIEFDRCLNKSNSIRVSNGLIHLMPLTRLYSMHDGAGYKKWCYKDSYGL